MRHWNVRISEHIGISSLTRKQVKPKNISAAHHLLICNHSGMLRSILFLKSCGETSNHYFRHCHYYNDIRKTILHTVKEITNICLSDFSDETLVNLLLFRNSINSPEENKEVIKASINFILLSRSFAGALIYFCSFFRPC